MTDVKGWKWWFWFTLWFEPLGSWLGYLFRKADNPHFCTRLERLRCRALYHPSGEIFYNPGGFEPDSRCSLCGDYIG